MKKMKRMKRIWSTLLCVSLAFALAACGSSTQEETSASADAAEEVTFAAYTDEAAEVYAGTVLVFTDDLEGDESGDAAEEESGDVTEEESGDVSEDASGDASDEECVVSSCTCSDTAVAFTYEVLVINGAMTEIVDVEKADADADAESGDAEDAESGDASGDAISYYTEVTLTDAEENETDGYLFSETGEYLVTIAVSDAQGIDGELAIDLTVSDNTYVEDYGEGLALSGVMALSGSAYAEETLAEKYEITLSQVKEYCGSIEDADELLETVTASGVVDAYNSAAEALGSDSITEEEFISEAQAQIEEEEDTSESEEESESSSESAKSTSSSSGSSSSNSSGSSSSSSSESSSSSSSSSHTHTWVAVTEEVYHEEEGHYETVVVQEEVKEKRYICKGCGASFTADEAMKCVSHTIYCNGGSSYTTGWVVVQEEVTEQQWVVDVAAYTETVITGYKCSTCGATK